MEEDSPSVILGNVDVVKMVASCAQSIDSMINCELAHGGNVWTARNVHDTVRMKVTIPPIAFVKYKFAAETKY